MHLEQELTGRHTRNWCTHASLWCSPPGAKVGRVFDEAYCLQACPNCGLRFAQPGEYGDGGDSVPQLGAREPCWACSFNVLEAVAVVARTSSREGRLSRAMLICSLNERRASDRVTAFVRVIKIPFASTTSLDGRRCSLSESPGDRKAVGGPAQGQASQNAR